MPRQDMEWLFEYGSLTPESAMQMLGTMQPTSKFGELFQYSNLMASAAGVTRTPRDRRAPGRCRDRDPHRALPQWRVGYPVGDCDGERHVCEVGKRRFCLVVELNSPDRFAVVQDRVTHCVNSVHH